MAKSKLKVLTPGAALAQVNGMIAATGPSGKATPALVINTVINFAIDVGVRNAAKLRADGTKGPELERAIREMLAKANETHSTAMAGLLEVGCRLIGDDPSRYSIDY